jgi:hypothetical protein
VLVINDIKLATFRWRGRRESSSVWERGSQDAGSRDQAAVELQNQLNDRAGRRAGGQSCAEREDANVPFPEMAVERKGRGCKRERLANNILDDATM